MHIVTVKLYSTLVEQSQKQPKQQDNPRIK